MTAPSNAYCVSSLAAVREVNNMSNKMTKSAAENTLANLVAKGWLYKTPSVLSFFFHVIWIDFWRLGADVTHSQPGPSLSWNSTSGGHSRTRLSSVRSASKSSHLAILVPLTIPTTRHRNHAALVYTNTASRHIDRTRPSVLHVTLIGASTVEYSISGRRAQWTDLTII